MPEIGKMIIVLGIVLVIVGVLMAFGPKIPFLGKLPGDIYYKTESGTQVWFPIVTCIVISVVASIVLNLFGRWW